eukprot:s3041_g10.t1
MLKRLQRSLIVVEDPIGGPGMSSDAVAAPAVNIGEEESCQNRPRERRERAMGLLREYRKFAEKGKIARAASSGENVQIVWQKWHFLTGDERPRVRVTAMLIEDWLDGIRSQGNDKQFDFLQLVADRLMVECDLMDPRNSAREGGAELLRFLLHGPPGTGKSHVAKFVKELFDLVGMKEGIDYQFVAFQATNAVDMDGATNTAPSP